MLTVGYSFSGTYPEPSPISNVPNWETLESVCPDARERAGPVFPPPPGPARSRARRASGQRICQFMHSIFMYFEE